MPEMTVAQSLPAVTAAQPAAGAPAADAPDPAAIAGGTDFAAVLKQQLGLPARDSGAESLAALLPGEAEKPEDPRDIPAAAPDLSTLLPGLAALAMNAAAPAPTGGVNTVQPNALPTVATPSGLAAVETSVLQPGALPFAPPDAGKGDSAPEGNGFAAARQSAVFAVDSMPTADTAALASATHEFRLPEMATEHAAASTQPNAAMQPAQASAANQAPAAVHVDTPVGARGWDSEVGQKVVWLARREESRAEMTLNPPQLGKIEVTLTVSGDQTNALFVSASPMTRDALENALPRLREILAEAGITLGQASVNAESSQESAGEDGREHARGERDAAPVQAAAVTGQWIRQGNGLIDTFA